MKKYIVFPVAFLFYITALAQNWRPINNVEKFNYSLGINQYYATIWVDSAKLQSNDSVYYFNKIIKKFRNGNGFQVYGYYLANQSQFLLSTMTLCSNYDVVFEESKNKKYRIKPFAKINDQWVFDSINHVTAQISRVYSENVFGHLDSVKIITLSSADSIILSKNSGILKFPLFNPLKQHVNLVGIEGRNVGTVLPKYNDFFDFNIGDVFCYKSSSSGRWQGPIQWDKFTILSKEIKNNGFIYKAKYQSKTDYYTFNSFDHTTYKNVTETILTYIPIESFLNDYPNEILNDPRVGYKYKPIVVKFDETFKTVAKSFMGNPFCNSSTDTIFECNLSPYACVRVAYSENYGKNVGLISRTSSQRDWDPWGVSSNTTLLGCIRNGQSYGTVFKDAIFLAVNVEDEIVSGKDFKIYPNPSNDWINIEISSESRNPIINICDLNGKVLLSQKLVNPLTQIYIGNLNSGAYFVKYISENNVKVEKLRKE